MGRNHITLFHMVPTTSDPNQELKSLFIGFYQFSQSVRTFISGFYIL